MAAAELLRKVFSNNFDADFRNMAITGQDFPQYLEAGTNGDDDGETLVSAYAMYKEKLRSAPVSINVESFEDAYEVIPGDEVSELQAKLHAKIVARRREKIIFYHLTASASSDTYKKGGRICQLFQRSKFIASKGKAGESNSLMLFNASLCVNKATSIYSDLHGW